MNDPMTLDEAADELKLDASTLRHQLRNGRLRGTKVGPIWTITRAELERYRTQSLGRIGQRPPAIVEPGTLARSSFEDPA